MYIVWELTPKQVYARVQGEPALLQCLDESPFETRVEAEQRRDALNAVRKLPSNVEVIRKSAQSA